MKQFSALIIAMGEFEIELEQKKINMVQQNLFEPFTAFKRIDQKRNGYLTKQSLQEFIQDNTVTCDDEEITYLFDYFDQDNDGIISYQDFVTGVFPKDNLELRQKIVLRESYLIRQNMLLPREVENSLTDFLLCIVVWNKTIDNHRKECSEQNYFQLLNKLFNNHATICVRKFYHFFNEFIPISKQCAMTVFKLIDKRKKQKVSKFEIYSALLLKHSTSIQNISEISVEKGQSFASTEIKKILLNQFQTPTSKKNLFLTTTKGKISFDFD